MELAKSQSHQLIRSSNAPTKQFPCPDKEKVMCRADLVNSARIRPRLSALNKNVRRKFGACAWFPYLLQRELPLFRQKHRDGAFGSKFPNQITLCEVLLFEEKRHDGNCVRERNRIMRFFVAFDQQG